MSSSHRLPIQQNAQRNNSLDVAPNPCLFSSDLNPFRSVAEANSDELAHSRSLAIAPSFRWTVSDSVVELRSPSSPDPPGLRGNREIKFIQEIHFLS
jgi:hypothetical protein